MSDDTHRTSLALAHGNDSLLRDGHSRHSTSRRSLVDNAEDLLQQLQADLELESESVAESTGVDRREFVFMSLVAAAASTFGVHAARAQGGATAPAPQQPTAPAIELGNGEPPAMVFQAYPGGTGALMEKLAKERGRAAFDRATFAVAKWS